MITLETNRLGEDVELKSIQAEASSANARINIPLNLDRLKHLTPAHCETVVWFHQYTLDTKMTLKDCAEALNYDNSVVSRVLNGIYEGSWKNVCERIESFKHVVTNRADIQGNEFVENSITRLIFAGLDYAMANNSITVIEGESRFGKTTSALEWRNRNNHGRTAFVTAPAYGGTKALMREICGVIGKGKNASMPLMHDAILGAFNENRMLIIDEAHRLLPGDRRTNPINLEILRDLHDRKKCGLAFLTTARFNAELKKSDYMFEQLLGRIGMPIRLPRKIKQSDIDPIIKQYVSRPSADLNEACLQIANEAGRLGILVENLKVASRIAGKSKQQLREDHVLKAIAIRKQMMGEQIYAAK